MKKTSRAGVSDTRAGLQPAGLFSNAGIFKKGFQDFHPLDESPYLLFDAESSMLGNLENPSLDLDASKAETLDVITATRAGIATYTAADGQIVTADPDTVRVDWSLGYPAMLIEPSATNLVDNSTTFSTTGSVTQQSGIDAPDGTNTATRISNISGAPAVDALYSIASSITPSAEITGSIFLRGEAGKTASLYVKRYGSGAFSSTPAESVLLTGEWQRYESPSFTLNADNTGAAVVLRDDSNTTVDTIDVWGGQIEEGSVSTSYIPTSGGSVAERTRNADNLVIDGTDFSDFFNSGGDGTFYIEFTTKNILDPQTFILVGHSGSQRYFYTNATDPRLLSYDGTFTSTFGGGSIQTTLNRAALSYNSSIAKSSLNGATDASVSHSGALSNATELNIGSSYEDALHLNGHIRRILYWPTSSDSL